MNTPIRGLNQIEQASKPRIERGITAVAALENYAKTKNAADLATYQANAADIGYGLMAREFAPDHDVANITDANRSAIVDQAAKAIIPDMFTEFYAFRIMVALGFFFLFVFAYGSYYSLVGKLEKRKWLLYLTMWSIPLPVLTTLFGWITAEVGRQPWAVYEVLPTFISSSTHPVGYMIFSLIGFALLYSSFIAAELYLMFKYARRGPDVEPAGAGAANGAPSAPTGAVTAEQPWK